jgi:DUF1365 family protein
MYVKTLVSSFNMSEFSAIYKGWIRHRRFVPVINRFRYPIFMMYLDTDEIVSIFSKKWYCSINRFNLVSFRRNDYFNPAEQDLKQAVIHRVSDYYSAANIDPPVITRVCMLGHLRYFNMVFNPVVIYYCFDNENKLQAILSEITNTPWGERHSYVHPIADSQGLCNSELAIDCFDNNKQNHKFQFKFKKKFHVSPFNPMNMDYRWVFSEPKKSLHIHMDNYIQTNDGAKHFDATLVMENMPLNENLSRTLIQQPLIIVKVVLGIYFQALKLWLKRSPFYGHPNEDSK